jgi:hypothetical protein
MYTDLCTDAAQQVRVGTGTETDPEPPPLVRRGQREDPRLSRRQRRSSCDSYRYNRAMTAKPSRPTCAEVALSATELFPNITVKCKAEARTMRTCNGVVFIGSVAA